MRLSVGLGLTDVAARSQMWPAEGYDLVLLAGQSNMEGRGVRDTSLDVDDARVHQYGGYSSDTNSYRRIGFDITPLRHPGATVNTNNRVGVGEYIGRALAASISPGRKVLLVPVAVGGTTMVGGTPRWNPGNPGGDLYENAIDQANRAYAAAQAISTGSRWAALCWIQGESDGDNSVTTADYLSAFNDLISGFRSRIDGANNAPFVVGSMVPAAIRSNAGYPAVDTAHMRAVLANENTSFVRGPTGLTDDSLHYNAAGIRVLGPDMSEAIAVADKSQVTYDFECDGAAATSAIGITSDSVGSYTPKIANATQAGMTGKYLTSSGSGAIGGSDIFGVLFDAVPSTQGDIVVEWTESRTDTASGRSAMTLRAINSQTANGHTGYLFQVIATGLRLFRVTSGTATQLGSTYSQNASNGRRYRASAIGTSLVFAFSDNGGETWTDAITQTDATYSTGQLGYAQGFGATNAGTVFVDDIVIRSAI